MSRLGNLHGLCRQDITAKRGLGAKSLKQLEEFLDHMLAHNFSMLTEEEFRQPGLPGVIGSGQPLIEIRYDGA